ncbi:MAG TPA: hypothetical protein VNI84_06345 [Pyrinomonadaceae bacterium]|nr:hypothetical protein [Pyrinomonadaceae bacterium]
MLLLVIPDENEYNRARVSQWESGTREPPREAQIRYSRLAGITLEVLLDDEQDLPAHIKKGRNRPNRGRSRKRHKKSITMNNPAGEEFSASNVRPEPPLVVLTDSRKTEMDNSEACAGNETPREENTQYPEELMNLLLLTGSERGEPTIFELPAETLDRFHDMYLRVQLQMPRSVRSSLPIGGIVNLAINVVLLNYERYGDESLIVKQSRVMTNRLSE